MRLNIIDRYKYYFLFVCLFSFLLLLPRCVKAQNWQNKQSSPNSSSATAIAQAPLAQQQGPTPMVNTSVNPITQAAVQGGVLACASRVNQISKFLTANTQSGAMLTFAPNAPDVHTFSASLELIQPNASSQYASTSFTPTPTGGCDAVYDTVQFVPDTCINVVRDRFKFNGPLAAIKRDIYILNVGAVKFFLMPGGNNGCVLIKKEVLQ